MMDVEKYTVYFSTLVSWEMASEEEREREFEGRVRAASRRGITNWVVPVDEKRREDSREHSTVLDVFVYATSTTTTTTTTTMAAAAAEKRGSRLVGVVHHWVNWRCSGHSVNPGRSITAKRSRCSSSKRTSLPLALLSSSSSLRFSLISQAEQPPFDFPKRRRHTTTAHCSRMDARGQGA